jgi:ribosomal-protein-alanine N-acetyltransferase
LSAASQPQPEPTAGGELRLDDVREADLAALSELEEASFITPWRLESLREGLTRARSIFLAARRDEELVGYALAWLVADELHLLKVAVRPDLRRRGYGRRLLNETLARAALAGATMVWLEVRPSNEAALALYAAANFTHSYARRNYFADTGEDALILVRPISPRDAMR